MISGLHEIILLTNKNVILQVLDGEGAHKVPLRLSETIGSPGTQGDAKSFFFRSIPTGELSKPQWIVSTSW